MTDEQVEKIIRSNMMLQMNLAGIKADFEEALQRTWIGLTDEEICAEAMKKDQQSIGFIKGAEWAEAKLKEKNT
jgi:hypothetical protein